MEVYTNTEKDREVCILNTILYLKKRNEKKKMKRKIERRASQGGQPSEAFFTVSSRSPGDLLRGSALCADGIENTSSPLQGRRCVLERILGHTFHERSTDLLTEGS